MKKKIYYLLFTLCLLLYGKIDNVSALEYKTSDIPNNTYVIGTHMYSDKIILTTEHIMLASKSIDSNNISDMIIYYKTPRGKWINGMTGDAINISDKITINYIDLDKQKDDIKYGDVNEDGVITGKDTTLIRRFLDCYDMSNEKFNVNNADVNGDGVVNNADVTLLAKYLTDYFENANLPDEPLGTTYVIEYIVDGDTYYVDYTLKNVGIVKIEDPTKEGYNFKGWYIDKGYKKKYNFSSDDITSNITLYAKFETPKYGDANEDGVINNDDLSLVNYYLSGVDISDQKINLNNADINGDRVVNKLDQELLRKYLEGKFSSVNLPEEPLSKTYVVKYYVDDEIYKIDYTLRDIGVVDRPTDPVKEGYTFIGWYTIKYNDEEWKKNGQEAYDNYFKFNFDNSSLIPTLYAYFVPFQYGDVNEDGVITGKDTTLIRRFLDCYDMSNEKFNVNNADVNGDGVVNNADVTLLAKYLTDYFENANLPDEPLGTTYAIEYIVDGDTYYVDYTLKNVGIVKIEDPTKEGYNFKGWYIDKDYKKKYDFGSNAITSNIKLYAKFE